MCLILIAWRVHPAYLLTVAANRDEFYARPSAPLAFWPDAPDVLGGRDLECGGSWLGVARNGRFAALTNVRGFHLPDQSQAKVSRGMLVRDFLLDPAGRSPLDYLRTLRKGDYEGFNLLVADDEDLAWYSNAGGRPTLLAPGYYGLSNGLLNTRWPKLSSAMGRFRRIVEQTPGGDLAALQRQSFALLADDRVADDTELPATGVSLEWERLLSAIFVRSPEYGTRASTLLLQENDGSLVVVEQSFDAGGAVGGPRWFFCGGL